VIHGKANTIHLAIRAHVNSEERKGLRRKYYDHGLWMGPQDLHASWISDEKAERYYKLFRFDFDCKDLRCCAPSHLSGANVTKGHLIRQGYCWKCRHRNWKAWHILNKPDEPIKYVDGKKFELTEEQSQ
jgi:hypothetical protein